MRVKKLLFWTIFLFASAGCNVQHQLAAPKKFQGMWKLDKFEIVDTTNGNWITDTTRIGYTGYILYDGQGHMAVQQTPKGYSDFDTNKNIDSLNIQELKKLAKFYRSNFVYFANYKIDSTVINHKRLSATNPKDWGTTLTRDFEFKGDTLILTAHEKINNTKFRIRWIRL